MTVRLRRGGIPLHKLTLEKVGVGRVGRQLQDLENDVSVQITVTQLHSERGCRLQLLPKATVHPHPVPPADHLVAGVGGPAAESGMC